MTARRIALLGPAGTGKTRLAIELAEHLRSQGDAAIVVPDALRAWCIREGRAPGPEEQLAIAQEQERQVDEAAGRARFVIADTTALTVLAASGLPFEDSPLHRFALARQQAYDATLVTGLDLSGASESPHHDASQPREAVDALLRALLQRAGVGYQVVYGNGPLRVQGALAALRATGVLPARPAERDEGAARRPWVWTCEKCSDPACEHRLFTQLRDARD